MSLPKYNLRNCVHFITINTNRKIFLFKDDNYSQIIIENLKFYRRKFGFKLYGYVIMPWHLHLLIWLPWLRQGTQPTRLVSITRLCGDDKQLQQSGSLKSLETGSNELPPTLGSTRSPDLVTIEKVIMDFKKYTAKEIIGQLKKDNNSLLKNFRLKHPKKRKHIYRIWQPDFYDFNIYSDKKLIEKLNYIHDNPVRANLCENSGDWLYSSFRNYYLNDDSIINIDKIE